MKTSTLYVQTPIIHNIRWKQVHSVSCLIFSDNSDLILCNVMLCHVVKCNVMPCDVKWLHGISYDVMWHHAMSFHIVLYHGMSCDVTWLHVFCIKDLYHPITFSSHLKLNEVMWYNVMWCDIMYHNLCLTTVRLEK